MEDRRGRLNWIACAGDACVRSRRGVGPCPRPAAADPRGHARRPLLRGVHGRDSSRRRWRPWELAAGFHECAQAWWDGLDPAALAAEHGADLALLNGPRNFIMDAAKAKRYGGVERLAGKRIGRRGRNRPGDDRAGTAAAVHRGQDQPPQHLALGRRQADLRAGGAQRVDVFVMQSYSRQVDPSLAYSQLPRIGPRIGFPMVGSTAAAAQART